jgi:3-oxoacyl-[acyl-carrier protein] reductase
VDEIIRAGGTAFAFKADVSSREEIDKMTREVMNQFGRINILVNNAGTLIARKNIDEMEEDLWDKVMDINLKSVYMVSQAMVPHMKKQGSGKIINVSSIAARMGGGPGAGHYSAAKAGMLALTKNMARELIPFHIYVNAVAPGVIKTRFHQRYTTEEAFKRFEEGIPMKRAGTPEEVASVILFLASEQASFIVGETIEVNGGQLMD